MDLAVGVGWSDFRFSFVGRRMMVLGVVTSDIASSFVSVPSRPVTRSGSLAPASLKEVGLVCLGLCLHLERRSV